MANRLRVGGTTWVVKQPLPVTVTMRFDLPLKKMLPDGFLCNRHVTDRATAQRQRELFHAPLGIFFCNGAYRRLSRDETGFAWIRFHPPSVQKRLQNFRVPIFLFNNSI
jgi:hypothetical protein